MECICWNGFLNISNHFMQYLKRAIPTEICWTDLMPSDGEISTIEALWRLRLIAGTTEVMQGEAFSAVKPFLYKLLNT